MTDEMRQEAERLAGLIDTSRWDDVSGWAEPLSHQDVIEALQADATGNGDSRYSGHIWFAQQSLGTVLWLLRALAAPSTGAGDAVRAAELAVLKAAEAWAYGEPHYPEDDLMEAVHAWDKARAALATDATEGMG